MPETRTTSGEGRTSLTEAQVSFLHGLAGCTGWADIRILGGMTNSERSARQDCRKAGLAEANGRLWRITNAGHVALAAARLAHSLTAQHAPETAP